MNTYCHGNRQYRNKGYEQQRSQWMKEKWKAGKKGYLKIHIVAVNVKTKKKILLSIMKEVTDDEHVHNDSSKELPELVENIIKSDSMTTTTIDKLFADGASMKAMR